MNEIAQKNIDFNLIYNRSYRLAAAVFVVSNLMDENEELKAKIKNLSLKLVSMSVNLKDNSHSEVKKIIGEIEKNSLELMSMLDIASISDLISKMNSKILVEEFQSFISVLGEFSKTFEDDKNVSVRSIFSENQILDHDTQVLIENNSINSSMPKTDYTKEIKKTFENGNGHKRKNLRKNMIFEFIKGHNNTSIKDIVPNITGCSEKTVQRELVDLINEGKVKKVGERRWSKYSVV